MLRMSGRGDDGTAKPIKTDNQGNVKVQNEIIDEVLVNVTIEPNTWFYSDFIDTSNANTIMCIPSFKGLASAKLTAWVEYSNDGSVVRHAFELYNTTTTNAGQVRLGFDPKVEVPMKFARIRIRHEAATSQGVLAYVRRGN